VATTKICQGNIYALYMDVNTKFKSYTFDGSKSSLLDVNMNQFYHALGDRFKHWCSTFDI